MKTAFTRELTLLSISVGQGHGRTDIVKGQKRVRASVSVPTLTRTVSMAAAGMSADLIARVRRRLYQGGGYNYAEYNGVRYRIARDSAADKDLFVDLLLTRG